MSLETGSFTVTWKVEGMKQLIGTEYGRDGRTVESPTFDNGRWQLAFMVGKEEKEWCSCFLRAVFQPYERTSGGRCEQDLKYGFLIQVIVDNEPTSSAGAGTCHWASKETQLGQGCVRFLRRELSAVEPFIRDDTLTLRCTISSPPFLIKAPLVPHLVSPELVVAYQKLFEEPGSCDVHFVFGAGDGSGELREIPAHKAFLEARCPRFKKFFTAEPEHEVCRPSYADIVRYPQSHHSKFKALLLPKPKLSANDDDTLEWLPRDWLDQYGPLQEELEEADASGSLATSSLFSEKEKRVKTVNVVDVGYTSFRALLHYLYTETASFTQPASNFTVHAVQQQDNAPASRRLWLLEQQVKLGKAVEPASPHAVYRLSVEMCVPRLKDLAKDAIIMGFTVKNILYELISTFACDFEEIQTAALDFTLKNWSEVKTTPAFDRVIDGLCSSQVKIERGGLEEVAQRALRLKRARRCLVVALGE